MNLEEKINVVKSILKDKKVAICFSGGADSTLLAYLASKVSSDVLAVTIDNGIFPKNFIQNTQKTAEEFNIKHHVINLNFFDNNELVSNSPKRCYYCRNEMYDHIEEYVLEKDFDFICDGNNISDLVQDRPGILITYGKNFKTPFIEARLTSSEIHEYLHKNNIHYSKSTTCIATRIQQNKKVTLKEIEKIKKSEEVLSKESGCELVKVRDLCDVSICEVDDFSKILNNKSFNVINDSLKSFGYKKVCLNLTPLDDDDTIVIDYENGEFKYQLPYTINLENSDTQNISQKIRINKNGLIEGFDFDSYDDALTEFMNVLSIIKRNV